MSIFKFISKVLIEMSPMGCKNIFTSNQSENNCKNSVKTINNKK